MRHRFPSLTGTDAGMVAMPMGMDEKYEVVTLPGLERSGTRAQLQMALKDMPGRPPQLMSPVIVEALRDDLPGDFADCTVVFPDYQPHHRIPGGIPTDFWLVLEPGRPGERRQFAWCDGAEVCENPRIIVRTDRS